MVKVDTKKLLFTLSCLAIITLIVLFARTYNAHASMKEGEKFGDWVVGCEKGEKGKQICFLSQILTSQNEKDEKNPQHVATFRIGYFAKSKELKMLQILPFGISLQAGTSIILGKDKLISPGKFTTCQAFGCLAVADLTKQDLESILGATEAYVGVMSLEGKQININLSTNGLKEGLEALK
jgi:invasion protein IalB